MAALPNRNKKLLILASKLGYQTHTFVEAAEALGVETFFATDRCHQLDDPWADGALSLHFEHPKESAEEVAREWKNNPPDAILALGDRPTSAAAYAAEALHIPANSVASVETCRNKLRQREVLRGAGLPVPKFLAFELQEGLANILGSVEFPCVVKPLTMAASQGVIRANSANELEKAIVRIRALLESPEIQAMRDPALTGALIETYIPGKEVAIEGLITDGNLRILAIFDKPDLLEGPYFEETIYVTPSRLPEQDQTALRECAEAAVRSLGLVTGPVHAEFRINENGAWVLEVAPRPIGGLCSRALRFGPKRISLEELLIRHALKLGGDDLDREAEASGVMMIPVPRSGIFERVEGMDAAEKTPGITEIRITARLRDHLAAWPEGSSYLGFIFARASSADEVENALRAAHAKLHFVFSPRLPVEHPGTHKIISA